MPSSSKSLSKKYHDAAKIGDSFSDDVVLMAAMRVFLRLQGRTASYNASGDYGLNQNFATHQNQTTLNSLVNAAKLLLQEHVYDLVNFVNFVFSGTIN